MRLLSASAHCLGAARARAVLKSNVVMIPEIVGGEPAAGDGAITTDAL